MNTMLRPSRWSAILALSGLAATALAAGPGATADDLGLTTEQKAGSAAIMRERQPALVAALKAAAGARREVLRLTYADPPDEAAIRAAVRTSAAAEEELSVQRARLTAALRAILTPAQKRRLARAQQDVLAALEDRSQREGMLLDAWIQDHGK